jgi:5-hydroxyisourate hydrolase
MLSLQVIETSFGTAAADVAVRLRWRTADGWRDLAEGRTAADGELLLWPGRFPAAGTYRIFFDLDAYYAALGTVPLYPSAVVEFRVEDQDTDLHMPLLVTPNSILTYRSDLDA